MLRCFRILIILQEIKQWKIILDTFRALLKPFYTLMMCMFIVYYVFAVLGDYLFGGLIKVNDVRLLSNPNVDPLYVLMNMNDLVAAFVTLFALMVVNNWFVVVETFTVLAGNGY